MESSPGVDHFEAINANLGIHYFLENTKENIANRVAQIGESPNNHQIYDLQDLQNQQDSENLNYLDRQLIRDILSVQSGASRENILTHIKEYFRASLAFTDDVNPADSEQSTLRRTAALLYKDLSVPLQSAAEGGEKVVVGPIGLGPAAADDDVRRLISSIGPVWRWDGNLPEKSSFRAPFRESSQEQQVKITPKWPEKRESEPPEDTGAETVLQEGRARSENESSHLKRIAEAALLQKMTDTLDHPSYLPKLFSETTKTYRTEFIPERFPSGDLRTRLGDLLNVGMSLEDMWKKGGYISWDVKSDNIRKRLTGDPVIVDLGGLHEDVPGADKVLPPPEILLSPTKVVPEVVEPEQGAGGKIKVETYLSFQMGVLLTESLFSPEQISEVLHAEIGFKWSSDGKKVFHSIDLDTFKELRKRFPNSDLPAEIDTLASVLLSRDPKKRQYIGNVLNMLSHLTENSR